MHRLRALALAAMVAAGVGTAVTASAAPDGPRLGDERVLLRTTRGDLVLAFYPDVAPRHTAQILKLVRLGVYDSTWIHRVEPNYLVQLSDAQNRKRPLIPEQLAAISKLPAELSPVPHRPGSLSMARQPADPNSGETSFSFLLNAAPHLDGKYTVFGELQWGLPLLTRLAAEPRDQRGGPVDPPVVEQALVTTAADIAGRLQAGQLREAVPLSAAATSAAARTEGSGGLTPLATTAILLILGCNLAALLLGPPWTRRAANVVGVVIGASLLIAAHAPAAARPSLLGAALFAGIVAVVRLKKR